MSKDAQADNPFLEFWKNAQQQVFQTQADWMSAMSDFDKSSQPPTDIFNDKAKVYWEQCREQFNNWQKTTGNWLLSEDFAAYDNKLNSKAFRDMLDPQFFLNNGNQQLNLILNNLADSPDFSDLWTLEKRNLKLNQELHKLQGHTLEFQKLLSESWARAFSTYTEKISNNSELKQASAQELMELWLKVADDELLSTYRSEPFLDLQRKIFRSCIDYKLKQREIVELWCESYSIPTRSEIDDLHFLIHKMKKQIRSLQQETTALKTELKEVKASAPQDSSVTPITRKAPPKRKARSKAAANKKPKATPDSADSVSKKTAKEKTSSENKKASLTLASNSSSTDSATNNRVNNSD